MNREIKFRVWDKNLKQFFIFDHVTFYSSKRALCFHEKVFPIRLDEKDWKPQPKDFIIQQFTGLKDRNGKEIFEGDIVQHRVMKDIQTVIFKRGSFGFKNKEVLFDFIDGVWTVIGNIHENSELLKKLKCQKI